MQRRGRPIDNVFAPTENLCHRVNKQSFVRGQTAGQFLINFPMPDTSVNRSKPDGQPADVLLQLWPQYEHWGIVAFEVRQIPTPDETPERAATYYKVQHDPIDHNYYHSEIRAFRDRGCTRRIKNLNKKGRTWFRVELSQRLNEANIIKEPEI